LRKDKKEKYSNNSRLRWNKW